MRPLVATLIALLPASAFAQFTLTLPQQQTEVAYGRDDCNSTVSVTWSVVPQFTCSDLVFWISNTDSCPNAHEPDSDDVQVHSVMVTAGSIPTETSGNFNFRVSDLPLFKGTGAPTCPADDEEVTYRLCAGHSTTTAQCGTSETAIRASNPPRISYDTRPPAVPAITRAQPLDGAALISVESGEDVSTVIVEATAEGHDTRSEEQDIRNGSIQISGLVNGVEYSVIARARDLAGNESESSEPTTVTPVETAGFWQIYKEAGGAEQGGCAQAGGGALGLGALALVRIIRRRRS